MLSDLLGTSNFDPSAAALTSERQRNCCVRALDSIKEARSALESGVTLDAVNVCADCAVDALLEGWAVLATHIIWNLAQEWHDELLEILTATYGRVHTLTDEDNNNRNEEAQSQGY